MCYPLASKVFYVTRLNACDFFLFQARRAVHLVNVSRLWIVTVVIPAHWWGIRCRITRQFCDFVLRVLHHSQVSKSSLAGFTGQFLRNLGRKDCEGSQLIA